MPKIRFLAMKHSNSRADIKRHSVKKHFSKIAPDYDRYKSRAAYYHVQLKSLACELIPDSSNLHIAEIGCGTGSVIAALRPKQGVGYDISEEMIDLARQRFGTYENLEFKVGEAETLQLAGRYDAVIMLDVLEHLYDSQQAIRNLSGGMKSGSILIIAWANKLWSPILFVLEKLKMKMPEGDHDWEPLRKVIRNLESAHFDIVKHGTRCLIPAAIPGADTVNRLYHRWPVVKRLGLIRYVVAKRK